jgi:hypothetical protein
LEIGAHDFVRIGTPTERVAGFLRDCSRQGALQHFTALCANLCANQSHILYGGTFSTVLNTYITNTIGFLVDREADRETLDKCSARLEHFFSIVLLSLRCSPLFSLFSPFY